MKRNTAHRVFLLDMTYTHRGVCTNQSWQVGDILGWKEIIVCSTGSWGLISLKWQAAAQTCSKNSLAQRSIPESIQTLVFIRAAHDLLHCYCSLLPFSPSSNGDNKNEMHLRVCLSNDFKK